MIYIWRETPNIGGFGYRTKLSSKQKENLIEPQTFSIFEGGTNAGLGPVKYAACQSNVMNNELAERVRIGSFGQLSIEKLKLKQWDFDLGQVAFEVDVLKDVQP